MANRPHLLHASTNARRMQENLEHVVGPTGHAAIGREIDRNVRAMLDLARAMQAHALGAGSSDWRHRVSRLYYAAYHASRAVRFHVSGEFTMDASDHKRAAELPRDVPSLTEARSGLAALRDDRNVADYDHDRGPNDLSQPLGVHEAFVARFLETSVGYLEGRGWRGT